MSDNNYQEREDQLIRSLFGVEPYPMPTPVTTPTEPANGRVDLYQGPRAPAPDAENAAVTAALKQFFPNVERRPGR